jgi:DNA-binding HxlR family transcriptional regulator
MEHAVRRSVRHDEYCPLDTTLSILSGKWKSIILCRLMQGPLHFGEIRRSIPSCSKRALAMQLAELEQDRVISKEIEADRMPVRTLYRLTDIGESLVPIIRQMDEWGRDYLQNSGYSQKASSEAAS